MTAFLNLPGIGGSGPSHWQSQWEATEPSFDRFRPGDWNRPDLCNWLVALDDAIDRSVPPPILVAHSLACLLVSHASDRIAGRVKGAFLVAVPDPAAHAFPQEAASFADPPRGPIPFPTLIVASSDDPYASQGYVRQRANEWNAGLIEVGALGHINGTSNLGTWAQGRMLLDAFRAGLRG
ncbi:MAG: alpha/beta hydrolase [Mesorhizobium sp.]